MSFSEWKEVKLGELLNFRRGHDLPKTKMLDGDIPVVGSNGVIGFHNECTTKAPCLTIGRSGNIGNPCYINKDCWAHNTSLYVDDFKGNDAKYLYYLLKTLNLGYYGGGSAVPTLNRNHIHPIEVMATQNTEEQKAIAHILSTLDEKIEVNNKINKILENISQSIFKEWFVDFEFPNEEGEPYKSSGGEMIESELGMIPKGWEVKSLYEIAEYLNGTSFKKNEMSENTGIPIIKIAELKEGVANATKYCISNKDEKYYLKNGDILFSWSGNPETSIDIFIWYRGEGILNQHIFKVTSKNYPIEFIYIILKCFKPIFTRIASNKQTTGLGHVTISDLKKLNIALPDNVIINQFLLTAKPIIKKIHIVNLENNRIIKLRDNLLPKLMSGEIRVPF